MRRKWGKHQEAYYKKILEKNYYRYVRGKVMEQFFKDNQKMIDKFLKTILL